MTVSQDNDKRYAGPPRTLHSTVNPPRTGVFGRKNRPWCQSLKFPALGLKPTNEGSVSAIYSLPYQISVASQIDPGVSPYMLENAIPWGGTVE